jgi:xanthine dehydrogenase YagS FAD-binding subunit
VSLHLTDAREIEEALSWLSTYWNRPNRPIYHEAASFDEALSLLEEYKGEARILAGGIDLIGLMKNKIVLPRALINIKTIRHLDDIAETSEGLHIRALTVVRDIERSPLIASQYPLLAETAQSLGSPQIRNMATVAGNLCQEVRCWYYRRSPVTGIAYHCRRKGQDGACYAVNGENENHAILGGDECFAICPSDMATALLSLDARIETVSSKGKRIIPMRGFYTNLGNLLEFNEIITGIQIPKAVRHTRQRYLKFRTRKAIDFPIVSVAVAMALEGGVVSHVRITLGGVAPIPYQAVKAEKALMGERFTEAVAEEAAEASTNDAVPLSKNGYKIPIVKALVRRALLSLKDE